MDHNTLIKMCFLLKQDFKKNNYVKNVHSLKNIKYISDTEYIAYILSCH